MIPIAISTWISSIQSSLDNDPYCDFCMDLFDPIGIGKDLYPSDDIVYTNIALLWFLFNIYRNIECGWMFQLNDDATYCINRDGVASLLLSVNSLGHMNNPICWAIIPEKTEGRHTYAELWFCVQAAAINALNHYECCDDIENCEPCFMVHDLRSSQRVQALTQKKIVQSGTFQS
jgi:hypothetical protein